MNGTTSIGSADSQQIQRQTSQHDTNSDHARSPDSPLSVRHGKLAIYFRLNYYLS